VVHRRGGRQCLLVIKQVFHLPLRAMSGLAISLVHLMGLDLVVTELQSVCRRQQRLGGHPALAASR
jgi:Transposase DDE domain